MWVSNSMNNDLMKSHHQHSLSTHRTFPQVRSSRSEKFIYSSKVKRVIIRKCMESPCMLHIFIHFSLTTLCIYFMFMFHHTQNESIKGSEHIQGTDLLHFKYERSHRKFVGRSFHSMSLLRLPLCFTIWTYKSTADKNGNVSNDSHRLIKELCLISFKPSFFSTQDVRDRRSGAWDGEKSRRSTFHIVRNSQRISIFKL